MLRSPAALQKALCAFIALLLPLGFPSLLLAAPTLTQLTPAFGQPGDVVTITGSGFALDPAKNDAAALLQQGPCYPLRRRR